MNARSGIEGKRVRTSNGIARMICAALCALPMLACDDPTGVDQLSDFMIHSPGDYFFIAPSTIRPSATSTDSLVFKWGPAPGAEKYSIIFKLAESLDSLTKYQADLTTPTFSIPVDQPQTITIPFGTPNPQLDTLPITMYPALQHVVKLRDLDAMLASFPKNVPLYFVWSIQAHQGSRTARSIEKHRIIFNRL